MSDKFLAVSIFAIVYIYIIFSKRSKSIVIWSGILILLLLKVINISDSLSFINWNVLGIFAGTLVLAEFFIYSRVPVLIADHLINNSKTVGGAFLWICVMTSLLSAFIENVATVLIIAPIALVCSKKLNVSPVPFIIGIAISSNLQGTATLIGDPPSMILASYEKMNFNDFFWYHGKPGIFFAVQLGAVFSFFVLYLFFKKFRQPSLKMEPEAVISWIPTYMICGLIVVLAGAPVLHIEFEWFGLICMAFGLLGVIWGVFADRSETWRAIKEYDWDTTFFLAGIFVMVGLLQHISAIDDLKNILISLTGESVFGSYTLIVWMSIAFSAFIDNVPYITAMIPVAHSMGEALTGSPYLMVFGLLIGSCLGGNITPIGASANIVGVGLLRKEGYRITFWDFIKIGLPFTLAATAAAYVFIWFVWS
ncbi:SLC13 family permease [candidate division KSB1 bacterium]